MFYVSRFTSGMDTQLLSRSNYGTSKIIGLRSKQPLTEVRGFSLEIMRDHSTKIRPQSPRDWPYLPGSALDSLEAVVPVYSGDQPAAHWSNLRWAERRMPATAPRSRLGASGSLQQSASARAICLQGHYSAKRLLPRLKSGVSGARKDL